MTRFNKRMTAALLAATMAVGLAAAGCGGASSGSGGASSGSGSGSNGSGGTSGSGGISGSGGTSGTEQGGGSQGAKGRYVETLKNTPDGLESISGSGDMAKLSDGGIALLNRKTGELHVTRDGGDTWETEIVDALAETAQAETEIIAAAVAPDGGIFFSYYDWGSGSSDGESTDSIRDRYFYVSPDGNAREISLKNPDGLTGSYLSSAVFSEDGSLYGTGMGGYLYSIDLEKGEILILQEPASDAVTDPMLYSSRDYLVAADAGQTFLYQISTGEKTEDDDVLADFLAQELQGFQGLGLCVDNEESVIYTASPSGLYSHVIGGSVMEQLLDGGLCNLSDPTKYVVSLIELEDGSFLAGYSDGEIDRYAYDEDAPTVPEQQISVYSLRSSATVSKAVSSFRKSHPDVYVKHEIGLSGEDGVTAEDAIRSLNTRMLAGEGPDVLLLDGMPIDSYIEKGILMDLSDLADGLEAENEYFSGIFRAFESEEGLFAIPVRYYIPAILGEKAVVEGAADLDSFAEAVLNLREENPDAERLLGTYTAEELLERLYYTSSPAWEKDGELDEDALRQFLAQALNIYGAEHENVTEELLRQRETSIQWRSEYDPGGLWAFEFDAGPIVDLLGKKQVMWMGLLTDMSTMEYLTSYLDQNASCGYGPLPGQSEHVFLPDGIVGISADTKEQETAAAFLGELLGIQVQQEDLGDGFPVNADAFDGFTENPNPDSLIGFSASEADEDGNVSNELYFEAAWPDDAALATLKSLIESLSVPSATDEVVKDMVLENGVKILEGDMSLEEGCKEIIQKAGLYFAE